MKFVERRFQECQSAVKVLYFSSGTDVESMVSQIKIFFAKKVI